MVDEPSLTTHRKPRFDFCNHFCVGERLHAASGESDVRPEPSPAPEPDYALLLRLTFALHCARIRYMARLQNVPAGSGAGSIPAGS